MWGRDALAEPWVQRYLASMEKAMGRDSEDVAQALKMLGVGRAQTGRYTLSEEHLRRALSIHEKQPGGDPAHRVRVLTELAELPARPP